MDIRCAESDAEIARCHAVMVELRPQYDLESFVAQVRRQMKSDGYRLAYLEEGCDIHAVAGFRIGEFLAWGRTLYVDDLVTRAVARSKGFGARLLDWLVNHARSLGCRELHLDSGVHRFDAHRFYLRQHMRISAHHFAMDL